MPNLFTLVVLVLGAWGILAPAGVWAFQKVGQAVAVRQAVKASRADEQAQCATKIAGIQKDLTDAANQHAKQAEDAAAAVPAVPDDVDGLRKLCARSASCRDRGKL